MPLVLVRVDCRLIHGQVIEGWVPYTGANCVIVANDSAAGDVIQKSIMEMAVPPTVDVFIMPLEEAILCLSNGKLNRKRILLLFADCQDALHALRSGLHFERLNLGNLVCSPGKTQVSCSLSFDTHDVDLLREIEALGIVIEAKSVPHESPVHLNTLLQCFHDT